MNKAQKFVIASNASSMAFLLGVPVTIQAGDVYIKAMPGDTPGDVSARNGLNIDDIPSPVDPPDPSDEKLVTRPGEKMKMFPGPIGHWIGRPDPGHRGETVRTVPFDNFEEGK